MLNNFIDAHVHLNTNSKAKLDLAREMDVRLLSINTDIPFFPSLSEQENLIHEQQSYYKDSIKYICSFEAKYRNHPDWAEIAIEQIKKGIKQGAAGVKIWKNIGMDPDIKDPHGNFIMIDDPQLKPVFEYLEKNNILLIGHQGEPRNCWLPLEEMTVDSDRNYFSAHPEYHMFKNSEYPSYEDQMRSRDNILANHPDLRYVGLHLFSMEWSLDEVANRLDRFPNSKTDLAERICHVQLQSMKDREKVREFFIKYQDRIIYGTDVIDDGSMNSEELKTRFKFLWNFHWDYFATDKTLSAPEFKGNFKGLALPDQVLEKIFRQNAINTYNF